MKAYRFLLMSLIFVMISLLSLNNCSKQDKAKQESDTKTTVSKQLPLTDKEQIEKRLSEALVRLSYKDKTGLYNCEFPYLREETNYDAYLLLRGVSWAFMDTVVGVRIKDMNYFGPDSVDILIDYVYVGLRGDTSYKEDQFMVYKYNNEWYKPTASTYDKQLEFDRIVHSADSAANAEAGR